MLWKKESAKDDALYVDFLAKVKAADFDYDLNVQKQMLRQMPAIVRQSVFEPPTEKSEQKAEQTREFGNSTFKTGDWHKSMEWYNECLCSAPERSKNIPFAYANRASCFLKLKMYAECLIDIENAKQAGYPTELMPKLDQRKANCLKEMEGGQQQQQPKPSQKQFIEQLSYEPNENFPSMANVLNVTKDGAGKYSVIANEDIDVGQIVVAEKALFGSPHPRCCLRCYICLKSTTNLVPCKKCTKAMFCSADCQSNRLHEYECGVKFGHNRFGTSVMATLRSILVAIDLFSSADALMNFVEQTQKCDELVPATMKDATSQYRAYIKQETCVGKLYGNELGFCIAPIYKKLMSVESIKTMFQTKARTRFLQHLIGNHLLVTSGTASDTGRRHDESQVYMIMKYFQHSCTPNMISIPMNGRLLFITTRPIKKGEELFDSTESRKRDCCENKHRITCECKCCKGIAERVTPEQRRKMASDPNFKYIMAAGEPSKLKNHHEEKLQTTINKCVQFLKEYGHVAWCVEIDKVMSKYRDFLRAKYDPYVIYSMAMHHN